MRSTLSRFMCARIGSAFLSHSFASKGSIVPSNFGACCLRAVCTELGRAHSSSLAIPHKDPFVGAPEPFVEAAIVAEVGSVSKSVVVAEPVVFVAAAILPLVAVVGQSQRCCQPEVAVHFC